MRLYTPALATLCLAACMVENPDQIADTPEAAWTESDGGSSDADSVAPDTDLMQAGSADLGQVVLDCSPGVVRPSCLAHLRADCAVSGVYRIAPPGLPETDVWCEMSKDGGGWVLVYSNSNNWADVNAADITASGLTYRWYDSVWRLGRSKNPFWLGQSWFEGPLTPENVGGIDVKTMYTKYHDVRFEFVRGSDKASASGWCATSGDWDWRAENTKQWRCGKLCLSGLSKCDEPTWNSGWTNSVTLGNMTWDYAFQSAPNAMNPNDDHGGSLLGFMVAGYDQLGHLNNASDDDFQIRIWLR